MSQSTSSSSKLDVKLHNKWCKVDNFQFGASKQALVQMEKVIDLIEDVLRREVVDLVVQCGR